MDLEQRLSLVREVGEEIITEQDLRQLLEAKKKPIAYDGFEPSGKIHIAQGILRAVNVNKMTKAGCHFKLWVADWHAWANNKLGGDLSRIRKAGEYMIEVWKATGMDLDNVEFIWASEFMGKKEYWARVMQIATHSTLQRVIRCSQIMGRSESDTLHASQVFYPCMQAADIFELDVDIVQLGMDQRKVNVFARDIADKFKWKKPVAVHHHMLMGLTQPASGDAKKEAGQKNPDDAMGSGQDKGLNTESKIDRTIALKMSKSKPDSAIFMTDSKEEIQRKISKAYCPEKSSEGNPVLEYCRYIVFEKLNENKNKASGGQVFEVERPQKFGGNVSFASYAELEASFVAGKLHPMDLKNSTAKYIDEFVEPVRRHFEKNSKASKLLEEINSFG